jgi:hypothetical protein
MLIRTDKVQRGINIADGGMMMYARISKRMRVDFIHY